jgi:hypothetical protein
MRREGRSLPAFAGLVLAPARASTHAHGRAHARV